MSSPIFFAPPSSDRTQLRIAPRLASWNRAGDPDQVKLSAALSDAEDLSAPCLADLDGPLALRLDVGLVPSVSPVGEHDLDNYLYSLAAHLMKRTGRVFVSVWGSKARRPTSFLQIGEARPTELPADQQYSCTARTTASGSTTAYKQQVRDQLVDAVELPDGPVQLQVAFVVGPRRNWLNLWKPTIDALDLLLGRTRPDREWHPRDGRIVELGLHCTVDGAIGNEVVIEVAAGSLRPPS